MLDSHSLGYWILLALMIGGVLSCLVLSGLFVGRRAGLKRANRFFAFLLLTFGLTLLHHVLVLSKWYDNHPGWKFLPIYMSLSFPPLLFYYVKLNLYSHYRFVRTDIKHFLLPLGQWLYFLVLFFQSTDVKSQVERSFYNPFFGAAEHALYIIGFFAYSYFAWRYTVHAQQQESSPSQKKLIQYLRILVGGLLLIFAVHTSFLLTDFFAYELLAANLQTSKWYMGLGIFSFVALTYFLCVYAIQELLWGRRLYRGQPPKR